MIITKDSDNYVRMYDKFVIIYYTATFCTEIFQNSFYSDECDLEEKLIRNLK